MGRAQKPETKNGRRKVRGMAEIPKVELLTPLRANFTSEDGWEEHFDVYEGIELYGEDLVQYEDAIQEKVDEENQRGNEDGSICNLMDYFHGRESIKEKVESAIVSVKNVDGTLYGCTTLALKEFLDTKELSELCEYITGQYSDGWGEGFEQRDIPVDGGTLNVHFWNTEQFQFRTRENASESEKQPKAEHPKMKLTGQDGNVFSILGRAGCLLRRNGQPEQAEEMRKRVLDSKSYDQALHIISEYVETELSQEKGKSGKPAKKKGREQSR